VELVFAMENIFALLDLTIGSVLSMDLVIFHHGGVIAF